MWIGKSMQSFCFCFLLVLISCVLLSLGGGGGGRYDRMIRVAMENLLQESIVGRGVAWVGYL